MTTVSGALALRCVMSVVMSGVAVGVAAQVAREGAVDVTLCWGGPMQAIVGSANDRFGTYNVTGGTRAPGTPFDAMSVECLGSYELRARTYRHQGYCVYQDAAGDKVFGSDATTAQGYGWQFVGGTGKFEGISGSGTVERVGNHVPVRPGTIQGCRRVTGSYRLP